MKRLEVRQQTAVPAVGRDESPGSGTASGAQLDLFELAHAGASNPLTPRNSPPRKQREARSE